MLLFIAVEDDIQKQPFAYVLQNRCSWKFRNIHRKAPVLGQRYLKETPTHVFLMNNAKFLKEQLFL